MRPTLSTSAAKVAVLLLLGPPEGASAPPRSYEWLTEVGMRNDPDLLAILNAYDGCQAVAASSTRCE